jgi:hypothetical protein
VECTLRLKRLIISVREVKRRRRRRKKKKKNKREKKTNSK